MHMLRPTGLTRYILCLNDSIVDKFIERHMTYELRTLRFPIWSCDKRARRCGIVLERRWDFLLCLVIPREPVDARLDQDKAELGVFVLAVALEVLADGHGLRQDCENQAPNFFSQVE